MLLPNDTAGRVHVATLALQTVTSIVSITYGQCVYFMHEIRS